LILVRVVNRSHHPFPAYASPGAAGLDLRANLPNGVLIAPFARQLIPTGLFLELPLGYEGQVRPRSGLAAEAGITVLNSPGTIDSDYRGEIKVLLANLSNNAYAVTDGDRIAQLVIAAYEKAEFLAVDELSNTDRGVGGFGHSGKR